MNDLAQRTKEIIETIEYINIATVASDGMPWNTPVYAAHDDASNFYWSSWANAEHSKNIRGNEKIFVTIYDSRRKRGDNHQRGLYIQATAQELNRLDDISNALVYFKGVGNKELSPDDFGGGKAKRLYKAVPQRLRWPSKIISIFKRLVRGSFCYYG